MWQLNNVTKQDLVTLVNMFDFMKQNLGGFIILIFIIFFILFLVEFYSKQILKIPEELPLTEQLENLDSIILKNTEFKDFSIDNLSFKYPDWKK